MWVAWKKKMSKYRHKKKAIKASPSPTATPVCDSCCNPDPINCPSHLHLHHHLQYQQQQHHFHLHPPLMASPDPYQPNAPPLPDPDYQPLGDWIESQHAPDPRRRSAPPFEEGQTPLKAAFFQTADLSGEGSGSDRAYRPSEGYGSFQNPAERGIGSSYGAASRVSYQQYVIPPHAPQGSTAFGFPVVEELPPEWSSGLCHCCADVSSCLLGCLCPCIILGKNAESLDDNMTSCGTACIVWYLLQQFTSCGWIYSCGYRRKLRSRYNLPERPCPDCLVHFCCWPCAFCQEHREMQVRKLREEAAWTRRTTMVPPSYQSIQFQR